MKKSKRIIIYSIISIFVVVLYFFTKSETNMDFSIDSLRNWVSGHKAVPLLFIGLWIFRLIAIIPGVTLMIVGGLIFSPIEAFTFSLIGLVLSDSLIYLLGKSNMFKSFKNKLKDKHSDILILIEEYNYKFLALGVLCPIAPTDVICYLSSYLGLGYKKFILTFILANTPALLLYSYLGESFENSIYNTMFIVVTLLVTGLLSLRFWKRLKSKVQ